MLSIVKLSKLISFVHCSYFLMFQCSIQDLIKISSSQQRKVHKNTYRGSFGHHGLGRLWGLCLK